MQDDGISYLKILNIKGTISNCTRYEILLEIEKESQEFSSCIKKLRESIKAVLSDKARSGKPKKFTLSQEQQIVSLACDKPENHGIIMTDWSQEMLAKVAVSKGLVESISQVQVGRILKKTAITTAKE